MVFVTVSCDFAWFDLQTTDRIRRFVRSTVRREQCASRDLELDSALEVLAQGSTAASVAAFNRLDHGLTSLADRHSQTSVTLAERGRILLICDALARYRVYFDEPG
jgi:hypothetical protein